MTNDELIEKLYAALKQLDRLIDHLAPEDDEVEQAEELLNKHSELVAHINRLNMSALVASTATITKDAAAIDNATKKLKSLTAEAHNIATVIEVADKVIAVAAAIATKL